jgi:hypothetical protein
MSINWDEVLGGDEADEDLPLPVGKYDVQIVKAEAVKASTGSDMIKIQCSVTTGPYKGRMLFTNIVLKLDSTNTMKFALRKLKGLGISRDWLLQTGAQPPQIAGALAGKTASADVEQREYQGEMRNDIAMFKAVSATGPSAMPEPPAPTLTAAPPLPEPPTVAAPATNEPPDPF